MTHCFTIADCVAVNASAFSGRVALEVIDPRVTGDVSVVDTVTYGQLWRRVGGLAATMRGRSMVGVLLPNGIDATAAYLAGQLAGAAIVPLNNRLAASEIDFVLRDASVSQLIAGAPFLDLARDAATPLGVEVIDVADIPTPVTVAWAGPSGSEAGERHAVVGYTSGTTGFPKGCVWTNSMWLTRLFQWGWTFGMSPDTVLSVPGPLFHLSYAGLTLGSLSIGARARIFAAFDPVAALDEYDRNATFVFLVPSMLALVAEARRNSSPRYDDGLAKLRMMLSSGAPGPLSLLEEAFDLFPNATIAEAYGWTEGGWVTFETKQRGAIIPHSVGWPMIGSEVVVIDPDNPARRVAIGEAGEVVARTLVPFVGYLGRPDATAASLTDDGFVRSGDVGIQLADGRLTIVDRVKDMIISGGENVYCAEVERILLEHPGVSEAAVFGLPDDRWGERVVGAIVVRSGSVVGASEVIAFCRHRLAHYKCPKQVVVFNELPRNPMGKVQKFRLVELLERVEVVEPGR